MTAQGIPRWTKATPAALVALLLWFAVHSSSNVFYVPGVHPQTFQRGEVFPLLVNALTSVHAQIPYDYYHLPFCQPKGGPGRASQNMGQILTGNKIQSSPYEIEMLEEVRCRKLCQVQIGNYEAERFSQFIQQGYHHNWILDNLPSAYVAVSDGRMNKHFAGGFPIGFNDFNKKQAYIFNHVKIVIDYHPHEEGYRVVGFGVQPISVQHRFPAGYEWDGVSSQGFHKQLETCPAETSADFITQDDVDTVQIVKYGENILFTYDVTWKESELAWSSRWVVYLTEDYLVPGMVHWYSIMNSLVVVVCLSAFVTCILVKNLRKDKMAGRGRAAPSASEVDTSGPTDDGKGWQTLHGDVFRPPQTRPMLFAAFVGSGVQLALTTLWVIVLSMLGYWSPARRGCLLQGILVIYALCGYSSGFVSGRLLKTFGGRDWKGCSWLVAGLFPGCAFGHFFVCGILQSALGSTGSLPLPATLLVLGLWGCVCLPLTSWGTKQGYLRTNKGIAFPTEVHDVPRPVPPPSRCIWKTPILSMVLTGLAPFAAMYVELFFIMTSLWTNQYYYVFGFTFIVYLIVLVTSAQVTILAVYLRLKAENHVWWWQAFFWSGSIGFYILAHSFIFIWFGTLEPSPLYVTYSLYFGYMLLLSFGAFLLFGSVGFMATLLFVCRMYSIVNQAEEGYVELHDSDGSFVEGGSLVLTEEPAE